MIAPYIAERASRFLTNANRANHAPVTIYTTAWCPYCRSAKALLTKKGAAFTEIDVEATPGARQEMTARAGGRTSVPQIFIGEKHVG